MGELNLSGARSLGDTKDRRAKNHSSLTHIPIANWHDQGLIDAMPIGVYVCDRFGVLIAYNRRAAQFWGYEPRCGDSLKRFSGAHKLYRPDGSYVAHAESPIAAVLRTHAPTGEFEAIIGRADGTRLPVLASVSPLFDEGGDFAGFVNCVQNLATVKALAAKAESDRENLQAAEARSQETARALEWLQQREEERKLLAVEMQHRVKNTLSVVQALVYQTLRTAPDTNDAIKMIGKRLASLSRSYDLLADGDWHKASMSALVKAALDLFGIDESRIYLEGDEIFVLGPEVLGFSLVLHELATNAIKYGALSVDTGTVKTRWAVSGDYFEFVWEERGGPVVAPPRRRGFGSRLLDRAVSGPERKATIDYRPTGVRWRLRASSPGFVEAV